MFRSQYTEMFKCQVISSFDVWRVNQALDPDSDINAGLTYHLVGQIRATVSEGLDSLRRKPFTVDPAKGVVRLNFDPLKGMKGYFDFEVNLYFRLG